MKIKIAGQLWNFETNKFDDFKEDNEVYVDGYLYGNIEILTERLLHNWDTFLIITGDEGDGKSQLAKEIPYVVKNILIKNKVTTSKLYIVWTPTQFRKAVLESSPYDQIVYDEAISGLSSRRAMSGINTTLVAMAAQCRKKRLFVIVVLPAFHDLDKNIAIHRSRGLIHVYTDKFERGYFSYYTKEDKRYLYVNGKKYYDMKCQRPEFRGRFVRWSFVDELKYEADKDASALTESNDAENKHRWMMQRDASFYCLERLGWTHAKIAEEVSKCSNTNLARNSVSDAIRQLNAKNKRVLTDGEGDFKYHLMGGKNGTE